MSAVPGDVVRFEAEGVEGFSDRRLEQASNRLAPVDEVLAMTEQWGLQEGPLVAKAERRGVHRKRRAASPCRT